MAGGAEFTFTAPRNGIVLRRSTTYFIVVDVTGAGLSTSAVRFTRTSSDNEDSNFDWSIANDRLTRPRLATSWTSATNSWMVALVGYERPNPEISGADAHRIRQEICPDDLISTATHHRIFRDQIIVGRVGDTNEYGYVTDVVAGAMLNNLQFGRIVKFPRPAGAYDGVLSGTFTIFKITVENGTVRVRLHFRPSAAERAALEMRVCGQTLNFADATETVEGIGGIYTWSGVNNQVRSALLWNRLNLASIYTGQPVEIQHEGRRIATYGTVTVSLGVKRGVPRVTKATVTDTTLTLSFDRALDASKVPAGTDFEVSVRRLSAIGSKPRYVTEPSNLDRARTVTNVAVRGSTVTLTLNAAPPKYQGNFRPGLVLSYTPPASNPLTGTNGLGVIGLSDRVVYDLSDSPPIVISATVTGTNLPLHFNKVLQRNTMIAPEAFSVRVGPISGIDPVPDYTPTRTVTGVVVSGSGVVPGLNAAPPQFAGNYRPGLLLTYTPPASNPLVGDNGQRVSGFTDLVVRDLTPDGGGTLVVMNQIEGQPPEITETPTLSAAPGTAGWTSGDTVEATLTFTEAVTVDTTGGTPSVTLQLGGTTAKTAGYLRGSGTTALVFGYTLTDDDGTHTAMVLDLNSLTLNGGTIRSRTSGFDALLEHVGAAIASPPVVPRSSRSTKGSTEGGVTAAFRNAPGTHDGAGEFTVELHFSEEPPLSFRTVQGSLLETANATIRGARRLTRGSNLGWEIRVRPDGAGAITLTLPVRPCSAANAICVDGAALGAAATATIPYAAPPVTQTPLTASFTGMPAGHNGGAFTFELALSEDVRGLGYERVRDSALTVSGGTVTGARRLVRGENRRWEVRVNPGGLGDVTVALAATQDCAASGAICTPEGKKQSTSTGATIRGPALSVADASVEEGSGAELAFTVTLGHAAGRSISVRYATSDGTATAGSDYTATSGTLTFAAGETSKIVSVPVLDDAHDEGAETMTLSNPSPSSVALADAAATGTIKNSDPLPQAWLAHFGRTMGSQVLEAVVERTDGGPSGSYFNVGGVSLGGGTPLDAAEPLTPGDWLARQMAAGPQAPRPQERALTGRDLLLGSSFHLVSQAGEDGGGAVWSAWGRVGTGGFRAEVGGVTMDGDVVTGMLGVDAEWECLLAGVLVLRSEADGAYNLLDGDDAGTLDSALTGVYPYARLRFGGRLSVWAVAGIGTGDLTLARAGEPAAVGASAGDLMTRPGETIDTGLDVRLGALGVRGALAAVGGFDLAVKSDVLWVRTASDAVPGLAATSADVNRLRLILEGGRPWTLSSGAVLAPTVQIGLRHDGGDAETGTGVEVGAGLRYSAGILSVDAQVRTLLAHEAGGYEEWGASGSIRLSPNAAGLGPSLAVLPSWGAAGSGVERLWSQPDASALVPGGGVAGPAGRVDAELGWGLAALRGRGVLTPYARLALAEGQDRSWHLGTRLALVESLDLSLEGSRRQTGGGTAHDLTLRATTPW